jgi:hypothetical protein
MCVWLHMSPGDEFDGLKYKSASITRILISCFGGVYCAVRMTRKLYNHVTYKHVISMKIKLIDHVHLAYFKIGQFNLLAPKFYI